MSKKKKIIVLSCMIALLAVISPSLTLFSPTANCLSSGDGDAVTTANYFTQYRSERMTSRNEGTAAAGTRSSPPQARKIPRQKRTRSP